jgi:hypothetical protein
MFINVLQIIVSKRSGALKSQVTDPNRDLIRGGFAAGPEGVSQVAVDSWCKNGIKTAKCRNAAPGRLDARSG